jgi:hypothetical protein
VDEKRLYHIIDFILNHAESSELEVIRAALRKREGGGPVEDATSFGKNIGKMANDMAAKVSEQVGVSQEQIRNTVRGFVRDMIRREAPELRETQIEELLDEWVPGKGGKSRRSESPAGDPAGHPAGDPSGDKGKLPADVILTMVRQFAAFGTGSMTVAEENSLNAAMPDWQQRYWARFSQTTRKLITLFVKGVIPESDFWEGIYDELGLDASGAPSPS